mmetsp:Transcript_19029/g.46778  ORF Transcript_19029/g.46778 Transcript_19029/m.46778 type:complete len:124 (+) Transcript_19029:108-479(+)
MEVSPPPGEEEKCLQTNRLLNPVLSTLEFIHHLGMTSRFLTTQAPHASHSHPGKAPFARCRPALFGTAILARTLFAIGTIAAGVATYEWISGSKKHLAQRIDHLEEQLMTSKPQIATPPPTSQ